MAARLLCEASYRLARAGGPALTEEDDELIEDIMTTDYRLRQRMREQRRQRSEVVKGARVPEQSVRSRDKSQLRLVK